MAKRKKAKSKKNPKRVAAGKKAFREMSAAKKAAARTRLARHRAGGRKRATSAPGGGRKRARAKAAVKSAPRRAARGIFGFVKSLNTRKLGSTLLMLDGVAEGVGNALKDNPDPFDKALSVLAPIADGAGAAKFFSKAASSSATAPGLMGEAMDWRFFGGNAPVITPRRLINAAPSGAGWFLAFTRYREQRVQNPEMGKFNLFPRLGAMTGIRVRNTFVGTDKATGAIFETHDTSLARDDFKTGVLSSPLVPVLVGGAASKIVMKTAVM